MSAVDPGATGASDGAAARYTEHHTDKPRPPRNKVAGLVKTALKLAVWIGLPLLEAQLAKDATWGWRVAATWDPTAFPVPLPPLFGVVVLVNVIICSLVLVLYLGFGVVIKGRKAFGYKLPVMQAAQDILELDVEAGGKIFSGGDVLRAKQRWLDAMDYNCHQRAHHQPLETFTPWMAMSLLGGLKYPLCTALWGLLGGVLGRIYWAKGYASHSGAGSRYKFQAAKLVWDSMFAMLFICLISCFDILLS